MMQKRKKTIDFLKKVLDSLEKIEQEEQKKNKKNEKEKDDIQRED